MQMKIFNSPKHMKLIIKDYYIIYSRKLLSLVSCNTRQIVKTKRKKCIKGFSNKKQFYHIKPSQPM